MADHPEIRGRLAGTGLLLAALVFNGGCGTVFIRAPADGQTQISSPFTLEAQKNDKTCTFDSNSFRAYLDQIEITSAFTRPPNSNIWTAQNYQLPAGTHTFSVKGRFTGSFCGSGWASSDSQQLTIGEVIEPYNLFIDRYLWREQKYGQTFTASRSGQLLGIEVAAARCLGWPQNSGTFTLEVGQGATTAGSASISVAGLPTFPGNCNGIVLNPLQLNTTGPAYFDLGAANINLVSGQTYFFNITHNSDPNGFMFGASGDVYPDGLSLLSDIATINFDLAFKVVIRP